MTEVERLCDTLFDGSVRKLLAHQDECILQGAYAEAKGLTREDCPYPAHSMQWEFWVYGNEGGAKGVFESA